MPSVSSRRGYGVAQLERFAKLVPKDKLARELMKAFTPAPTDKPKAGGH
jgi:hypothetical protein